MAAAVCVAELELLLSTQLMQYECCDGAATLHLGPCSRWLECLKLIYHYQPAKLAHIATGW